MQRLASSETSKWLISSDAGQGGDLPRSDQGWAYEFKWDGSARHRYRRRGARCAPARSHWKGPGGAFRKLNDLGAHLEGHHAVLDGEIVAFDGDGRSDFGLLQQRLTSKSIERSDPIVRQVPATFLAFDLLELDGHDLLQLPYDDRRKLLEKLQVSGGTFATPPTVLDGEGSSVLAISREHGMEGVVAKRRDSTYLPDNGRARGSRSRTSTPKKRSSAVGPRATAHLRAASARCYSAFPARTASATSERSEQDSPT